MNIPHWLIKLAPVLPLALVVGVKPALAQARVGVGAGYGYGYGGYPYFGGPWGWFGNYPAANGSFWTNGLTLYGPPVPTFGVVPGSFGGSDAHRVLTQPPIGSGIFGVGIYGYRNLPPRPAPRTIYLEPPPPPSVTAGGPPPIAARAARITVRLPQPNATLWIDKKETRSTGSERTFESPELADGQTFEYKLIARWISNGQEKAESRTVTVTAGQSMTVDFNFAE